VCGQAAAALTQAMAETTNGGALPHLARELTAVAARMEPKEAAAVCGQAAAILTQAMAKTTDPLALPPLAQGLSAVAARMEPKEAAAVCSQAATALTQAIAKTTESLALQGGLAGLQGSLSAVLLYKDAARGEQRRHSVAGAVGVLSSPGSVLVVPGLLQPALEPPPPPLPAQTLVDLLKQPFCVGVPRRLVLEELQRHYQRPFADQWEFVRFAKEQQLPLDLKTPPQRPAH
jgi:hypothetical protein